MTIGAKTEHVDFAMQAGIEVLVVAVDLVQQVGVLIVEAADGRGIGLKDDLAVGAVVV